MSPSKNLQDLLRTAQFQPEDVPFKYVLPRSWFFIPHLRDHAIELVERGAAVWDELPIEQTQED